jgi:hypothetical protein
MSYNEDISVSEGKRQVAHKAAVTEIDHRTAETDHLHRLAAASHKWSVHNGAQEALASRYGVAALIGAEQEPVS